MKKVLCVICIYIIFILIYLLQSHFFSWFTIGGVSPNLFIILTVFIGLFMRRNIWSLYRCEFGVINRSLRRTNSAE